MKKPTPVFDPRSAMKDFDKTLTSLCGKHEKWRLFSDFVEMSACAFDNVVLKKDKREEQYLSVVKRYSKEETTTLASLLGMVTLALEHDPRDVLGDAFMRLELSSHWHGQFFTPFEVATLMAGMTIGNRARMIKRQLVESDKDYITIGEPACGGGAMIIAFANVLRKEGVEPQQSCFFEAWDLDRTAAHMTMVQLSLLHLPARIVCGDSLSREIHDVFYTPAYHLGLWSLRMRNRAPSVPPIKREPVK